MNVLHLRYKSITPFQQDKLNRLFLKLDQGCHFYFYDNVITSYRALDLENNNVGFPNKTFPSSGQT